jgi:hypothetical protein
MIKLITAFLLAALSLISCQDTTRRTSFTTKNHDGNEYRELVTKNPLTDIKVEIKGRAIFNKEETAIIHLTDKGYINYKNGENRLEIKNESKVMTVQVFQHDKKIAANSKEAKEIIQQAILKIKEVQNREK